MKKKLGKSENDKWQRRKWGGSFPLLDHMVDGNPKEKMKEKRKRKRKRRNEKMSWSKQREWYSMDKEEKEEK